MSRCIVNYLQIMSWDNLVSEFLLVIKEGRTAERSDLPSGLLLISVPKPQHLVPIGAFALVFDEERRNPATGSIFFSSTTMWTPHRMGNPPCTSTRLRIKLPHLGSTQFVHKRSASSAKQRQNVKGPPGVHPPSQCEGDPATPWDSRSSFP